MRIDEFSNAGNIDGVISATEQTQFLLFGFTKALNNVADFSEKISIYSPIIASISFNSKLTNQWAIDSNITKKYSFDSLLKD